MAKLDPDPFPHLPRRSFFAGEGETSIVAAPQQAPVPPIVPPVMLVVPPRKGTAEYERLKKQRQRERKRTAAHG